MTRKGILTREVYYPRCDAAWNRTPLVKNLVNDFEKLISMLYDPWQKKSNTFQEARKYMGESGLVTDGIGVPSFHWFMARGSIQDAIMDFYDYPDMIKKFVGAYSEYALEYIKASCEKSKPELFMFGGSYASMSVISPELYREHNLPFLQEATSLLKKYGVVSGLHMCGRSNEMLGIFAEETDLVMIEPLERPPGGNVSLREAKAKYGKRLCLKGNVNTFKTLAKGSPENVIEEARKCIEDGGEGGGFILSSGDQVPGITPEENFKAMIKAAREYGKYV